MTYLPRCARVPHAANKLMHHLTTISETIQKPLIAEAQIPLGKQKIQYGKNLVSVWQMD